MVAAKVHVDIIAGVGAFSLVLARIAFALVHIFRAVRPSPAGLALACVLAIRARSAGVSERRVDAGARIQARQAVADIIVAHPTVKPWRSNGVSAQKK